MSETPVRTCIGCRRRRRADELVRVALDGAGRLRIGRGPGRGAWLCRHSECFDRAERRQAFGRALRTEVKATEVARLRSSWFSESVALGRSDHGDHHS